MNLIGLVVRAAGGATLLSDPRLVIWVILCKVQDNDINNDNIDNDNNNNDNMNNNDEPRLIRLFCISLVYFFI